MSDHENKLPYSHVTYTHVVKALKRAQQLPDVMLKDVTGVSLLRTLGFQGKYPWDHADWDFFFMELEERFPCTVCFSEKEQSAIKAVLWAAFFCCIQNQKSVEGTPNVIGKLTLNLP